MLTSLRVRDLAVLEDVEVAFGEGLTVLTGETGAGKSLVVDAVMLLAGGRADPALVRAGAERLVVEGAFDCGDAEARRSLVDAGLLEEGGAGPFEVVVRREVAAGGKGRLLVNGSPAALKTLQEIAPRLLVLYGQAEARDLLDPDAPRQLLDRFAGLGEKAAEGAARFREFLGAERDLARLNEAAKNRVQRLELLDFQIGEIDKVEPKEGEDEEISSERKKLASVEKIGQLLATVTGALESDEGGAIPSASAARRALQLLEEIDSSYAPRSATPRRGDRAAQGGRFRDLPRPRESRGGPRPRGVRGRPPRRSREAEAKVRRDALGRPRAARVARQGARRASRSRRRREEGRGRRRRKPSPRIAVPRSSCRRPARRPRRASAGPSRSICATSRSSSRHFRFSWRAARRRRAVSRREEAAFPSGRTASTRSYSPSRRTRGSPLGRSRRSHRAGSCPASSSRSRRPWPPRRRSPRKGRVRASRRPCPDVRLRRGGRGRLGRDGGGRRPEAARPRGEGADPRRHAPRAGGGGQASATSRCRRKRRRAAPARAWRRSTARGAWRPSRRSSPECPSARRREPRRVSSLGVLQRRPGRAAGRRPS